MEQVHKFPIPASGAVLRAIQARANDRDLPLGRAAVSLIEDAIAVTPPPVIQATLVNLEDVPTDDIIDELVGRLQRGDDADTDRERADAMQARAEAAEARLADLVGILVGITRNALEDTVFSEARLAAVAGIVTAEAAASDQ